MKKKWQSIYAYYQIFLPEMPCFAPLNRYANATEIYATSSLIKPHNPKGLMCCITID